MLGAIVLAGGASSRMGSAKALLRDRDGRTFIARILRTIVAAGLTDVVVVTGDRHTDIVAAVTADPPSVPVRFAQNPDPRRGQLSSLWTGMDAAVGPDTDGLLVTLVDVPMIAAATVRAVVDVWTRRRAAVVRPAMGARHGHPVIFDRALFEELRAAPLDAGAKTVIRAHAGEIVDVPVDDPGCLVDIDTPQDYDALRTREGRD